MIIVLFDTPEARESFYPLSLTRPLCQLRLGIFTLREKWENLTGLAVAALTEIYLNQPVQDSDGYIYIPATVLPTKELVTNILQLGKNDWLGKDGKLVAVRSAQKLAYPINAEHAVDGLALQIVDCELSSISQPSHLFQQNEAAIKDDFSFITNKRYSAAFPPHNQLFGTDLFVEQNVDMKGCTINTETGPVYIGKNALVMEGSCIRGPVSIGEGAVVKMGTKLYGGTTIGPFCTAGGEIKNSILMGHSNKAHNGYLGDAVVGEWCNLGAGTTNSNVKNTASEVKMWHRPTKTYQSVGLKAGLVMGDYSRAAINTSFNTGTTVGVCCNVFEAGFPPKHVPSFTWGKERYDLQKAMNDIGRWMAFKHRAMEENEKKILEYLYKNN